MAFAGVDTKGFEELNRKLQALVAKAKQEGDPAVAVGFTAAYALYVHENMEIWPPGMRLKGLPRGGGTVKAGKRKGQPKRGFYWDPQGKAGPKFLEGPAREMREVFARIIYEALSKGKTLSQALLLAGLRLQREAQLRVPVDTGSLKSSAFTRLEAGVSSGGEASGGGEG